MILTLLATAFELFAAPLFLSAPFYFGLRYKNPQESRRFSLFAASFIFAPSLLYSILHTWLGEPSIGPDERAEAWP